MNKKLVEIVIGSIILAGSALHESSPPDNKNSSLDRAKTPLTVEYNLLLQTKSESDNKSQEELTKKTVKGVISEDYFLFRKNYEAKVSDTVLEGSATTVWKKSIEYQIDPYFTAGVIFLETAYGKSSLVKRANNVGGLTGKNGYMKFRSVEESVDYLCSLLNKNYINKGLDTPIEINRKYCPDDKKWSVKVASIMKKMYSKN